MFTLTLVTPERKILAGQEIEEVTVPAHRGEIEIFPGHAGLMTTLTPGPLKYRLKGESEAHIVAINWGYCQVVHNGVIVLAESAERPSELSAEKIEADLKDAQTKVAAQGADADTIAHGLKRVAEAQSKKDIVARFRGGAH
jgi:F-type H+-transporting ATPase subunit epsilon